MRSIKKISQLKLNKLHWITLLKLSAVVFLASLSSVLHASEGAPSLNAKRFTLLPIKYNQLGYYTNGPKTIVVTDNGERKFSLLDEQNKVVFKGKLSAEKLWSNSNETVRIADFSKFKSPGRYVFKVKGITQMPTITIGENILKDAHSASLKSFYYNRASIAIELPHGKKWTREAGHLDKAVYVHKSAQNTARPEGFIFSSEKGWYDAGDYNKYIVNSGISTFTLLAGYEQFPDFYRSLKIDIPENTNALPDILDEALWNIDWMLTMQDPSDGGVYHKLTTLNFEDTKMPNKATAKRYVVQKSTAAALNFAAVMAMSGRIYEPFFPERAKDFKSASLKAWAWAKQNSHVAYDQPKDVFTGKYDQKNYEDEFAWAAAELAITFQSLDFYEQFKRFDAASTIPGWTSTGSLGHISLLTHSKNKHPFIERKKVSKKITSLARRLIKHQLKDSAYGIAMGHHWSNFSWGSNGVALNQSLILIQAYLETNDKRYLNAAIYNVDYIFGRNPLAISFVTGFGERSPMEIHHRVSAADGEIEPIPGLVAGGPHSGQQDKCGYDSYLPALSYLDDYCSYSTNEVAINWNAPLVYVLGAIEALVSKAN